MPRNLETLGFAELSDDLVEMARTLSDEYGGAWQAEAEGILNEAAQPVLAAMLRHASPPTVYRRTGTLHDAIKIGRLIKRDGGKGYTIKIGNQADSNAFYAPMVEFGHGGPGPAPEHPWARPAYEETEEQSLAIIRARLTERIDRIRS